MLQICAQKETEACDNYNDSRDLCHSAASAAAAATMLTLRPDKAARRAALAAAACAAWVIMVLAAVPFVAVVREQVCNKNNSPFLSSILSFSHFKGLHGYGASLQAAAGYTVGAEDGNLLGKSLSKYDNYMFFL